MTLTDGCSCISGKIMAKSLNILKVWVKEMDINIVVDLQYKLMVEDQNNPRITRRWAPHACAERDCLEVEHEYLFLFAEESY